MNEVEESIEKLRQKLAALERRESELSKKYDRLIGKVDKFDPEINALMREGLPLELFTRVALLESHYEVHGYYPFYRNNTDGTKVERSVDIYASRDSTYTVPEGKGSRSGESWPERNNLLVEIKQRRENVRWLFCYLPTSKKQWSVAGKNIPIVNSGFEFRPSEQGLKSSGNPKDVNNAIAQLNQAYIPFLVERERGEDGYLRNHTHRFQSGHVHEHTWLLLVTNATLKVFKSQDDFKALLEKSRDEADVFHEEPWVLFKPERTLGLLYHQRQAIEPFLGPKRNEYDKSIPELMADHTNEVHIVNHDYLSDFLELVNDPPRAEKIQISFSVDGGKPSTVVIE